MKRAFDAAPYVAVVLALVALLAVSSVLLTRAVARLAVPVQATMVLR